MAKNNRRQARIRRHQRGCKHIAGTPERPRLAVFRSLTDIYAQVIDDEAGVTLAAASSIDKELRKQMDGKTKTGGRSRSRPGKERRDHHRGVRPWRLPLHWPGASPGRRRPRRRP